MKNILIAGTHSYIGEAFRRFMEEYSNTYSIREMETKNLIPEPEMFKNIDVVFCVVGIAHIKETAKNRYVYFDINRDLVVKIAKAAKAAGVRQFILLSSMSVYGLEIGYIKKSTEPKPITAYGESKLQADEAIKELEDEDFIFTCLRPPMVYGKNCKGNYQALRKIALKTPLFPNYNNKRSMIYIGNLCEFVKECIEQEKVGLFFPQNCEYTNTSEMVRLIAKEHKKKIMMTRIFNLVIRAVSVRVVNKVFGDLTYEKVDLVDKYRFEESVKLAEEE